MITISINYIISLHRNYELTAREMMPSWPQCSVPGLPAFMTKLIQSRDSQTL